MRVRTVELLAHAGERVMLRGRLHRFRRLGGVGFLLLADGWGVAQVVVEEQVLLEQIGAWQWGTVLEVTGRVVETAQAAAGVEIVQPAVRLIEAVTELPPFALHQKRIGAALPTLLDHAVIANRHPTRQAMLRLSAGAMAGFRAVLEAHHFTEVQSPKFVASATESGATVFEVEYFGRKAYLAQSPQFYKQIMVGVFERVFEVGPVFRAEKSATSRHLTEYVSLDVEYGFIENHFEVMRMVRTVLAGIFARWEERYSAELTLLECELPRLPEEIPHIHFSAAQELLWERFGLDERGEPDLSPQSERLLGKWAQAEYGSAFLFVTGYPMVKRPFYTHPEPEHPQFSNSFDLLFRGMELVTGGQRLHRYSDYLAALERAGLPIEPFASYLQAFKHGMPPHGGFAIGLERLLMRLLQVSNLRETTLFPRDMNRLVP